MKYIRYVFLTGLLAVMIIAFTACGGNNNQPTPTPNPTAPPATQAPATPEPPTPTPVPIPSEPESVVQPDVIDEMDVMTSAEYLEEINLFIDVFEELIEDMFEFIELLEEIETDEQMMIWIDAFEIVKESIYLAAEALESATPYVPDEHLESHLLIIAAMGVYLDALLELDVALGAAILGDEDAFWAGLENFAINLAVAFAVWDEALYGPMTHAPILFGIWGWEEMPEWVWIFNEDGTGSAGTPGEMQNFVWETSDVFPWLYAVFGELWIDYGSNIIEHWEFVVEVDHEVHLLELASLQVEGMYFVYFRQ